MNILKFFGKKFSCYYRNLQQLMFMHIIWTLTTFYFIVQGIVSGENEWG